MKSREVLKFRDPCPKGISLTRPEASVNSVTDRHSPAASEPFDCLYVRKLAAGDPETAHHFTTYFDDLLAVKLRARLRSKHAIEDIRQETYARVLEAARDGRLAQPERLGAFVHSVCNRVLFEFYRADTRTRVLPLSEPADQATDVESLLVSAERRQRVKNLIDALPPKDRCILNLLFFEDRDKDEVCQQLGVDRHYLRVLLHRAAARLRQKPNTILFLR